ARDNCDQNPALTFSDATTPGSCPQNKDVTRTWTATDACGNTATASQTIHVVDTTAPVIEGVGGPQTIQCDQPLVFSNPTARDNGAQLHRPQGRDRHLDGDRRVR